MAKDGTNRGGRRVRAGDKPKPLAEKIAAGEDARTCMSKLIPTLAFENVDFSA